MFVDTQVLIAAFIKESKYHKEARNLLINLKEIKISIVSLLELYYVLVYKLKVNHKDVLNYIKFLLSNPKVKIVSPTKTELMLAVKIVETENKPKIFSDKIVLAQSLKDGLLTFDKELAKEFERYKNL